MFYAKKEFGAGWERILEELADEGVVKGISSTIHPIDIPSDDLLDNLLGDGRSLQIIPLTRKGRVLGRRLGIYS